MIWNGHFFIGNLKGGFITSISILVYYDSCAFSSFNSNFLPLFQFLIILPWLELHPISSSAGLVPGNGSWWLILPALQSVTRGCTRTPANDTKIINKFGHGMNQCWAVLNFLWESAGSGSYIMLWEPDWLSNIRFFGLVGTNQVIKIFNFSKFIRFSNRVIFAYIIIVGFQIRFSQLDSNFSEFKY